ncbi:MAG: metallophosphoesterase family protein [Candidatus Kapaibacterium sp.]
MDLFKAFRIVGGTALVSCLLASCSKKPADDPVEYSFVVVGGCRMANEDTNTVTDPSTANIVQLDRTLEDVTNLTPMPKYVFFMGDEIFGYQSDPNKLASMLTAWRDHCEASPAMKAGITLVPILGNHESQAITESGKKRAYPGAEEAWLKVMSPKYIYGENGPHTGGPDSLETDQSKLSYSFNYRDTHFAILNTDPVGQDAHVPAHWVAEDLAKARKDGAKHIFALGHKPAFGFDGAMGLAGGNRSDFWAAMEANHADAMLASHFHVYSRFQPHPGKTWMIVSGDGGSPLEDNLRPDQQFFGFTVVSILKSGRVIEKTYGRNIPPGPRGYAAPDPADKYPTTVRDSADISWKD